MRKKKITAKRRVSERIRVYWILLVVMCIVNLIFKTSINKYADCEKLRGMSEVNIGLYRVRYVGIITCVFLFPRAIILSLALPT
jgi:hypothetical protein